MRIKQSFCLPCFHKPDGDLPKLLREAKQIGFAACEIWFRDDSLDRIVGLARRKWADAGEHVRSQGLAKRLESPRESRSHRIGTVPLIDVAERLNIPCLICFSGPRDSNTSVEDSLATTAAGLKRVLPYAEQKKISSTSSCSTPKWITSATKPIVRAGRWNCASGSIMIASAFFTTFITCRSWKAT